MLIYIYVIKKTTILRKYILTNTLKFAILYKYFHKDYEVFIYTNQSTHFIKLASPNPTDEETFLRNHK